MTVLYLARMFSLVFLGEEKAKAHEGTKVMLASVIICSSLAIYGHTHKLADRIS